jgi:carbon storage regulator
MLVLSRHTQEKILIGDDIVITVVLIGRDKVRLGIEAPEHVQVDREEVRQRINVQNRQDGRR